MNMTKWETPSGSYESWDAKGSYHPWLSIDEARRAVEIAKKEIIEKVVLHIIYNTKTVHYNNYDTREFNKSSLDDIINDLKQAVKDE